MRQWCRPLLPVTGAKRQNPSCWVLDSTMAAAADVVLSASRWTKESRDLPVTCGHKFCAVTEGLISRIREVENLGLGLKRLVLKNLTHIRSFKLLIYKRNARNNSPWCQVVSPTVEGSPGLDHTLRRHFHQIKQESDF